MSYTYNGSPCNGQGCPGWVVLGGIHFGDQYTVRATLYYVSGETGLTYQLSDNCGGPLCWEQIDGRNALKIAAGGGSLYEQHADLSVWIYTGTPCNANGTGCPGWVRIDKEPGQQG